MEITMIPIALIIAFFAIMRFYTNKKFNELLMSERYRKSKYIVMRVGNKYALKYESFDTFADLRTLGLHSSIRDRYFSHCVGSKSDIVRAFNYLHPEVYEVKPY